MRRILLTSILCLASALLVFVGGCSRKLTTSPAQRVAQRTPGIVPEDDGEGGGGGSPVQPPVLRPSLGPLFTASSPWRTAVDGAEVPLDAQSDEYIQYIATTCQERRVYDVPHGHLGSYFSDSSGFSYFSVAGNQPLRRLHATTDWGLDPGWNGNLGYPIPDTAFTEPGWIEPGLNDKHMIIVDRDHQVLYETWRTEWKPNGDGYMASAHWDAGTGGVFDLTTEPPASHTFGADAAGLPILAGLIRYDEVSSGEINHGFRVTLYKTHGCVWPAKHCSYSTEGPPLGMRMRLKASFSELGFSPEALRIIHALKKYGLIVADEGGSFNLSGTLDPNWNGSLQNELRQGIEIHDFEFIQRGYGAPEGTPPCDCPSS